MDRNTRIIDLTVGELQDLINGELQATREVIAKMVEPVPKTRGDTRYTGIKGLATALCCSTSKIMRLKREGLLEGGYRQVGRHIYAYSAEDLMDAIKRNTEAKKQANPYYRRHINHI